MASEIVYPGVQPSSSRIRIVSLGGKLGQLISALHSLEFERCLGDVVSDDLNERFEAHPFGTTNETSINCQVIGEGCVDERPCFVFDVDDFKRSRPGGYRDSFTHDGGLHNVVILKIAAQSSRSEPMNRLQGRELNAVSLAVDWTNVFDD